MHKIYTWLATLWRNLKSRDCPGLPSVPTHLWADLPPHHPACDGEAC